MTTRSASLSCEPSQPCGPSANPTLHACLWCKSSPRGCLPQTAQSRSRRGRGRDAKRDPTHGQCAQSAFSSPLPSARHGDDERIARMPTSRARGGVVGCARADSSAVPARRNISSNGLGAQSARPVGSASFQSQLGSQCITSPHQSSHSTLAPSRAHAHSERTRHWSARPRSNDRYTRRCISRAEQHCVRARPVPSATRCPTSTRPLEQQLRGEFVRVQAGPPRDKSIAHTMATGSTAALDSTCLRRRSSTQLVRLRRASNSVSISCDHSAHPCARHRRDGRDTQHGTSSWRSPSATDVSTRSPPDQPANRTPTLPLCFPLAVCHDPGMPFDPAETSYRAWTVRLSAYCSHCANTASIPKH